MTNYTVIDNNLITSNISDGSYRLYILLQSMCYGDKITCYPSIKFLAISLGRSTRTINRYIKELEKYNLIVKKRRGSISNHYTLIAKKAMQVGERVANSIKKAVTGSKTENKAINNNKSNKQSNWNISHRNYNFDKLEQALAGKINCSYEELLE
jgi:DNA-binding transcriptional regulator YhcF (GntR family)